MPIDGARCTHHARTPQPAIREPEAQLDDEQVHEIAVDQPGAAAVEVASQVGRDEKDAEEGEEEEGPWVG